MRLPEPKDFKAEVWRFVEDQSRAATLKLVDSPEEQDALEALLEETKPPLPEPCRKLHYLQSTPFRYAARHATRFRRRGERRGVFYAGLDADAALAEAAFYVLLFYRESPGTPRPKGGIRKTRFATPVETRAVDLREAERPERFAEPLDHAPCHAAAGAARAAGLGAILYASVRDPRRPPGGCVAVLDCGAFPVPVIGPQEGWLFRITEDAVICRPDRIQGGARFEIADFAADPRVA
ncbi:MAG: RES domain-containing protein [Hasllibacter sp.]